MIPCCHQRALITYNKNVRQCVSEAQNRIMEAVRRKRFCSELNIVDNVVVGIRGRKRMFDGYFEPDTELTSLTLPNTITRIDEKAFCHCTGLTSLTIPTTVTAIGRDAFYKCTGLTSLTLPSTDTGIDVLAFAHCRKLTSVTLPAMMKSVGDHVFQKCFGLTSLTLPPAVTSIGSATFFSCSALTSLTLPATTTSIGTYAFQHCAGLTSLTLPTALTNFGRFSFAYCTGLVSVMFRPSVPPAFIAWAVGSSRNRANWQLTTLKQSRNLLRLITVLALERRDVDTIDYDGHDGVFVGCSKLYEFEVLTSLPTSICNYEAGYRVYSTVDPV